jgi:tRNA (guanine37-N1)-methyltransferase
MKKIDIVSIFPDFIEHYFSFGVIDKAVKKNIVGIKSVDLRDYTHDKHNVTDKPGYGGNSGMVMIPQPFFEYYDDYIKKENKKPFVIMPSPQGIKFDNNVSKSLSKKDNLVFFCGRYEGIDKRVYELVDLEISVGDFVLTGGELPTLLIVDSLLRFVPEVVGNDNSVKNDSFYDGLLDYDHYTRPANFRDKNVPEVLLSGNHKKIQNHQKKQSIINTAMKRPDLFLKKEFNEHEKKIILEIIQEMQNNAE